jgi:hypothetical protein
VGGNLKGRSVRFIKSIVFILCFGPVWAEEDNGDAGEFLRGLEGVRVIVKASYVVKEKGITEEQLKTAVEGRLKKAGIQLSKDRMLPKDDPEAFWMETEPADLSPLILLVYGSRITLRLAQTIFQYEDLDDIFSEVPSEETALDFLNERLFARGSYYIPWERELIFTYETKERLFSHVLGLVEEFIKDFRAANPSMWVVWEDYAAQRNPFLPTIRSSTY